MQGSLTDREDRHRFVSRGGVDQGDTRFPTYFWMLCPIAAFAANVVKTNVRLAQQGCIEDSAKLGLRTFRHSHRRASAPPVQARKRPKTGTLIQRSIIGFEEQYGVP